MRIGFLSPASPTDRAYHSGCGASITAALRVACERRGIDYEHLGPLPVSRAAMLKRRVHSAMALRTGRPTAPDLFFRPFLRDRVGAARRAISGRSFDALVGLHTWCARVAPHVPTFLIRDGVIPEMMKPDGGYPFFAEMPERAKDEVRALERDALANAAAHFLTSDWAARSLRDFAGTAYQPKIFVTYRGSNLPVIPSREEVEAAIAQRPRETVRAVFNGRTWEHKGGPFILAVLEELRNRDVDCELDVLGLEPNQVPGDPLIRGARRYDLSRPDDAREMTRTLMAADFFPGFSRAETYGIAYVDAAACGVPSAAFQVFGIEKRALPQSRILFPGDATAGDVADALAPELSSPEAWRNRCRLAREDYEAHTWDDIAEDMLQRILEVLEELSENKPS